MKDKFSDIYLTLSKKERSAVLFAVSQCDPDHTNLHLGQLPFLPYETVLINLDLLLTISKDLEAGKVRPAIKSSVIQCVLHKLNTTYADVIITLDETKVKSQIKPLCNSDVYITTLHVYDGRVSVRILLKPYRKRNKFKITVQKNLVTEVTQILTFKYGLYN